MSADPEASGIALSATADHVANCFGSIIAALEGKVAARPAFDTSPSWYGALPQVACEKTNRDSDAFARDFSQGMPSHVLHSTALNPSGNYFSRIS